MIPVSVSFILFKFIHHPKGLIFVELEGLYSVMADTASLSFILVSSMLLNSISQPNQLFVFGIGLVIVI